MTMGLRRAGSIHMEASGETARLILSGELDNATNRELLTATAAAERHSGPIEIDTRGVTFLDSSVVAVFAMLAHRHPHRLRFIDPPDRVRFLLTIAHLDGIVDITNNDR
jgi:anti-sigma B factor antagonist